MTASSSRKVNKDEQVAECKVQKPRWLESFLEKTFFASCAAHPMQRNEINKYCVNCNLSACQHCVSIGPHCYHGMLKIYRHVYKDVVSLASVEKYIDCSQIQRYKCNRQLLIPLNPLPHSGSASNTDGLCNTCSRKLNEPESYLYCSISCKFQVKVASEKPNDSVPPAIPMENPPAISMENPPPVPVENPPREKQEEKEEETSGPPASKRVRRRKGTPHRAPFF